MFFGDLSPKIRWVVCDIPPLKFLGTFNDREVGVYNVLSIVDFFARFIPFGIGAPNPPETILPRNPTKDTHYGCAFSGIVYLGLFPGPPFMRHTPH